MSWRKNNHYARPVGRATAREKMLSILGESWTSARNKLIRITIFNFIVQNNLNTCFKCSKSMTVDDWSFEHKISWLEANSVELFWDLNNLTYSHKKCNRPDNPRNGSETRRAKWPEGTSWCSKEKKFLPQEAFNKDTSRWNGRNYWCRECSKNDNKNRYWNKGGKEKDRLRYQQLKNNEPRNWA